MHQPFIRERFSGDGGAAHYRGPAGERALKVRPCTALSQARAVHHQPAADEHERPRALCARREGRAALALRRRLLRLLHAGGRPRRSGHRDRAQALRYLPLIPIIAGAGGIVTTWEGGAPPAGGRIVAAGDKRVHAAALEAAQVLRQSTSEQRRAGHEGVERRPELARGSGPAPSASRGAPRARSDASRRAAARKIPRSPASRRSQSLSRGNQQQRLAHAARIAGSANSVITRNAASTQPPSASRCRAPVRLPARRRCGHSAPDRR